MSEEIETETMTQAEKIDILRDICYDVEGSFRNDYSGRGMCGRECVGIVSENAGLVVDRAAEAGITGSRQDQMGRRSIVYWPCLSITKPVCEPT